MNNLLILFDLLKVLVERVAGPLLGILGLGNLINHLLEGQPFIMGGGFSIGCFYRWNTWLFKIFSRERIMF